LSTLIITSAGAEDRIVIEASLAWENLLLNWDIGELDIRLGFTAKAVFMCIAAVPVPLGGRNRNISGCA
jgi:hypothetical protein